MVLRTSAATLSHSLDLVSVPPPPPPPDNYSKHKQFMHVSFLFSSSLPRLLLVCLLFCLTLSFSLLTHILYLSSCMPISVFLSPILLHSLSVCFLPLSHYPSFGSCGKNGPLLTILSFSKGLGLRCGFLVRSFHMIPSFFFSLSFSKCLPVQRHPLPPPHSIPFSDHVG